MPSARFRAALRPRAARWARGPVGAVRFAQKAAASSPLCCPGTEKAFYDKERPTYARFATAGGTALRLELVDVFSDDVVYRHAFGDGDAVAWDGEDSKSKGLAVDATVDATIATEDWAAFESVQAFLSNKNVDDDAGGQILDDLAYYLPASTRVRYDRRLARGAIGDPNVVGGVVAFCAYQPDSSKIRIALCAEIGLTDGALASVAVVPTPNASTGVSLDEVHLDAFKPLGPNTYVVSGNNKDKGSGFTYKWEGDALTPTQDDYDVDSHDVQVDCEHSDQLWVPSSNATFSISQVRRDTGETIRALRFDDVDGVSVEDFCEDVNHAQVVGQNEFAILSCRLSDSIVKLRLDDGSVEWVLGGNEGQFALVDADGEAFPPGAKLWYGQHNVEYVGDGLIYMFDNQFNKTTNSRAIAVRVDEAAKVATVEWEYTFGEGAAYPTGYSKVFGDHDRLPTSNHLAVWWPGNNTAFRDGANAEILELTDDKAHVLEIDIYGETDVLSTMYKNWKIYAVERVYARPLVWDARCDGDELSAKTVNTYKESHLRNGTLEFLDATGAVVASEAFQWDAFWSPTTVAAPPAAAVDAGAASLRVLNQHGQTSRALPISC